MTSSTHYIFDTNIISHLLRHANSPLFTRIATHQRDMLILSEAVIYEVVRGLKHRQAEAQLTYFYQHISPLFQVTAITLDDWQLAGLLWATTRANGKQLSNIDLLIGAMSIRLDAVVITHDQDFAYLPIKTQNWLLGG